MRSRISVTWTKRRNRSGGVCEHGPSLAHIHLADTGRLNPGTGSYDYPTFFGHLKAAGYDGLLSSECGIEGDPVASMRDSTACLRRAWTDA
ncbi:TIM barrel protein [Caballeronia sp. LZ032]|nr:TIM barrel protein [Caballeronia sp. LZ032]MDR5882809.1 TIM barrel protein [Caballeronia sp. LZ032]